MSRYYYVVNLTKKEYIKCPETCGIKWEPYFSTNHCTQPMLMWLIYTNWMRDSIALMDEHWLLDQEGFKDITLSVLIDMYEDPGDGHMGYGLPDDHKKYAVKSCPSQDLCIRDKKCICEREDNE